MIRHLARTALCAATIAIHILAAGAAPAQVDTPAAQDARAAIHQLHKDYGHDAGWDRWLNQPALLEVEYELSAGDRAEPAALTALALQLRDGSDTYFKGESFQRLAKSLETRAGELAPLEPAAWAAECRTRAEDYVPITSEAVQQARGVLGSRLEALERRLPSIARAGDEWGEYLYWPETRWLTSADSVDAAALDRLEIRWHGAPSIWNESPLVEASLAVQSYIRLLRAYLAHESQADHAAAWNELAKLVESSPRSAGLDTTRFDTARIAEAVYRRERLGQSSRATASIRRELSRPNIVLRARSAWLRTLVERAINEPYQVNDVYAGARTVGSGVLSATTRLRILPSGAVGHWIVSMEGDSQTSSVGYGDRVRVASHATTTIHGQKQFTIDGRGLTARPATAGARTAIAYDRIDADGIRLRRTQAIRQTHARRAEAEAQASVSARRSLAQRMDAQGAELAERFSRPYRQRFRDPQIDSLRMPPEVRVRATSDLVRWECRLEAPASFAAAAPPFEFEPEADVVLSLAASAVEEKSVLALGGRKLSADKLSRTLGELLGDTAASETPSGQDFQAVFATRPCTLEFADGQARAKFYITSFESENVQYPAMTVEAIYNVEASDGGLVLVRSGTLRVKALESLDGGEQPASGRQQTLRMAAQRKLNKALAERFVWSTRALAASDEEPPKLRVRSAQADGGWLQLALSGE